MATASTHQASPRPYLDHVVLLVPHTLLTNLPDWITHNFSVLTGGKHASGATENKLIVFQDGSYFEVIAFLSDDPPSISSSSWAKRTPGEIIDWACSLGAQPGQGTDAFPEIQRRVQAATTGLLYADLKFGGRTKPDGTELKWCVSDVRLDKTEKPDFSVIGGEAPFWCFDETPRELRVPSGDRRATTHPCGALGVAEVAVSVTDKELFSALEKVYATFLEPSLSHTTGGSENDGHRSWTLPAAIPSAVGQRQGRLTLRAVRDVTSSDRAKDRKSESESQPQILVSISLFSDGKRETISGHIGGKREVAFDLIPLDGHDVGQGTTLNMEPLQ